MLDIERVLKQDRLLRALTCLNRKAFEKLLIAFSPLYEQARQTQPRRWGSGKRQGTYKAGEVGQAQHYFGWLYCATTTIYLRFNQQG